MKPLAILLFALAALRAAEPADAEKLARLTAQKSFREAQLAASETRQRAGNDQVVLGNAAQVAKASQEALKQVPAMEEQALAELAKALKCENGADPATAECKPVT